MESQSLAASLHPPRSSSGPRRICSSKRPVIELGVCNLGTEHTASEWQTHSVVGPSGRWRHRGRESEAWFSQLLGRKEPQPHLWPLSSKPTPTHPGWLWQRYLGTSGSTTLHLLLGQLQDIKGSELHLLSHSSTGVEPWDQGYWITEDTHKFPGNKGHF